MGRSTFLTHDGLTLSIAGWARRLDTKPTVIHNRLASGMPLARALTKPVEHYAAPRAMQWCPTHEQALVEDITGQTTWHPISRSLLAYAHAVAVAAGCAHQIGVRIVPCPQCRQEGAA